MNLARLLAGGAKIAGSTLEGFGIDKNRRIADALNQQKQAADERRDAVLNAIAGRSYDPNRGAVVNVATGTASPVAGLPAPIQEPVEYTPAKFMSGGKAVQGFTDKSGNYYGPDRVKVAGDIAPYEEPTVPTPRFKDVVTTTPDGAQEVSVLNTTTGDIKGTGQTPGMRASASKPTGEQEKSYLFYNLMEKALPRVESAMKSGQVRKPAITAFMATPGLAADLVNVGLNAEEQSYIRNLRDFAAGVLRKESGAAVTHSELRDVFKRYATGFGDAPELDAEKATAAREYMESMKALAGPATDYYRNRERAGAAGRSGASADPEFDALMAKYKKKP